MRAIIENQKVYYKSNQTLSYQFRIAQLKKLKQAIIKNEQELKDALYDDLHKSSFEAYAAEVGYILHSTSMAIKSLKKWMEPKKKRTPIFMFGTKSFIVPEPYGQVLIIGPYNYPIQLVLEPLVGAIAAGNTIVIKPSEYAPHCEKVLQEMINQTFDKSYIYVVTGDYKVTSSLLDLRFDYIFFTGSTRVGQIVYEKASKHLTPVTLELGGKSPTIVDETADLKNAVSSISFGKFSNAGQTCIAPDYVYVHESVHDQFHDLLVQEINKMFCNKNSLGHIINDGHFERLKKLIVDEKVTYGCNLDQSSRFIPPIILDHVSWEDPVMKEEIFGPILPILTYTDINELISIIKDKEKPLALYVFSKNKQTINKVLAEISFGGGAINDTVMQIYNYHIPFGGVGQSGIGAYHGFKSFETFSHMKPIVEKHLHFTLAYPPYGEIKEKLVKRILK